MAEPEEDELEEVVLPEELLEAFVEPEDELDEEDPISLNIQLGSLIRPYISSVLIADILNS